VRLLRAFRDVDVRFDAIAFSLLCTVASLDWVVDEDCSELSAADGASFGPNAGDVGSDGFAAEAIWFQMSSRLIEFVSGALDDWSC